MPTQSSGPLTVAVVGATGAVGRTMLQVLIERAFPFAALRPLASARSAGTTLVDRRPPPRPSRRRARSRSRALTSPSSRPAPPSPGPSAPAAAAGRRGRHRQLLAVAHGNRHPAGGARGQRGRRREPRRHHRQPQLLDDAAGAAPRGAARRGGPGTGRRRHLPGRQRLRPQGGGGARRRRSRRTSAGHAITASVYPHAIAFNVLPQVDVFLEDGYTREEWKVIHESRKILHLPDLRLSCTAVRVPGLHRPLRGGARRAARPAQPRPGPRGFRRGARA